MLMNNNNENAEGVRLNKYIAESGFCSRREADRLIDEGKVKVNGIVAGLGVKASDADVVEINGQVLKRNTEDHVVYAYYKPAGVVTTMAKNDDRGLYDELKRLGITRRVFPVGRLDEESCGLLLLTDDGDLMNKILKTSNNHEKEYVVGVNKDISDDFLKKMGQGVTITDGSTGKKVVTRRCSVKKNGKKSFTIVLKQGLNRQIRRMCGAFDYEVVFLKRIRIMNITLMGLSEGQIRKLTDEEYKKLRELGEKNG